MGYLTNGLSFNTLRDANRARLPEFKNKHGEPAHALPDGSDWSPAQWLQALIGELGEFANIRKKFERGDLSLDEYTVLAKKELADVATYLDLLALRALDINHHGLRRIDPHGINLGAAVIEKFNEVSVRVGCKIRIRDDGYDWFRDEGK